jgi:GNAT superfamily N-acetyltransferase
MSKTHEPEAVVLSDGREVVIHETAPSHPDEYALGAHHEGELVGLLVCEPDEFGNGHLVVFVRPEWRRVGVGASLLRCMSARAADLGLTYLSLAHRAQNESASAMIEAAGAVPARRIRDGGVKVAIQVPVPTSW